MMLKLFCSYKLLSAWIIGITYFSSFNFIRTDSEVFECGIQSLEDSSSDPLYVRQYEFPWKTAIFKVVENGRDRFAGSGHLVNKNTILTMAHQIQGRGERKGDLIHNLSKFKIVLGLRKLSEEKKYGRKVFSVKKAVIHPNWEKNYNSNYEGDIAIVTLTEDVTFSRYIRPICIPDETVASITTGQISSWAHFDESRILSDMPRRKVIHILEDRECLRKKPLTFLKQSFCAGAEGYSFCNGSSGNGFYVQKNGKFYLRGMVSATANRACGTPSEAILTDVLKYRDFLEENTIMSSTIPPGEDDDDCGISLEVGMRVGNGIEVPHGMLPWLAALIRYKSNKPEFICGGTLVSAKTVVTAAHCVHLKGARRAMKNTKLRVVLGTNDLSDPYEPERRTMRVEKIVIHSAWNPSDNPNYAGDIALLVMEKNVVFDDYIRPVCLTKSLQSFQFGVVAGWGRREDQTTVGTFNNIPRKIEIPIVIEKICYEEKPLLAQAGWNESYCAGQEGVSVCDGDSGSGFYVKMNEKYYLKGIVSSAIIQEECLKEFYTIFTDAVKYVPFITEI